MSKSSQLEWKPKDHRGVVKRPCQFCGSTLSEDKFTIKNQINGKELLVGTSCINKFEDMDNKLYNIPVTEIQRLSAKILTN